ncbi:hypothetical protein B9206_21695 [Salmonella enterica]|nr:hypothetical protein [Salmonella enterica]EGX5146953.1 hypothetical protein [Salmonella enterica]HAK4773923.1 hypothetical protein [Salmonella enterica]
MINHNLTLKEKALAAAEFLRAHARHAESSPYLVDRIGAEPRMMAANAIEQLVKDNDELRAQIAKHQTTDYQSLDDLPIKSIVAFHDNHFTNGDRVRLKHRPDITGTIGGYSAFWLMHGSVIAYHVLLDHLDESIPIVTTALEPLPEADNAKQ